MILKRITKDVNKGGDCHEHATIPVNRNNKCMCVLSVDHDETSMNFF